MSYFPNIRPLPFPSPSPQTLNIKHYYPRPRHNSARLGLKSPETLHQLSGHGCIIPFVTICIPGIVNNVSCIWSCWTLDKKHSCHYVAGRFKNRNAGRVILEVDIWVCRDHHQCLRCNLNLGTCFFSVIKHYLLSPSSLQSSLPTLLFLHSFLKCFLHFNLSSVIEDRSANVLGIKIFIYRNKNIETWSLSITTIS